MYYEDENEPVDWELDRALETVSIGFGLLLVQFVISTDDFYSQSEIRKYQAVRMGFHKQFSEACMELSVRLHGTAMATACQPLEQIAALPATQMQQALVKMRRVFQGFSHLRSRDVENRLLKLVRTMWRFQSLTTQSEDPYRNFGVEVRFLLDDLVKYPSIPAQIKTLFRRTLKQSFNVKVIPDESDPGAWFELPAMDRVAIRSQALALKEEQDALFHGAGDKVLTPEENDRRYREHQRIAAELAQLQSRAGVNIHIIEDVSDTEPLDKVIRRESRQTIDAVTEFIVDSYITRTDKARAESEWLRKQTSQRDWGKIRTQLRACKTKETFLRVIRDAVERKLLNRSAVEDAENQVKEADANYSLERGIPLVPLKWAPLTVEEFQAKHQTGEIRFDSSIPDDERSLILGRVSRAVEDLEMVYGAGFCGRHAKKLAFHFGSAMSGTAAASYFGWDNSNRWQPRVKFGDDYTGLLAHELSHYMDDLMAFELEKKHGNAPEYQYGDVFHGSGSLFGNNGQTLENVTRWTAEGQGKTSTLIRENIPEVLEFMEVVAASPDYTRWSDYAGDHIHFYLEAAIMRVRGKRSYDDPELEKLNDVKFKSEIPADILAEILRMYSKGEAGDTRKLTYWNSGVEVWARMCEQYAYTRLGKVGIANPWLTHMSYKNHDLFMGQDYFEGNVEPVMDRLFERVVGLQRR